MSSVRLPRLAVLAWTAAIALIAVLTIAVWHYLSVSPSTMSTMTGMPAAQHTADAFSRAGGDPLRPLLGTALLTAWQLDAIALAVIVLAAAAYLTGVALVPARSPGSRWSLLRTASFLAGLAVCAYATCGAIGVYDQVLFTAHMAGHLALVMVVPALLVGGHPLTLWVAASPTPRRERIVRVSTGRVLSLLTAPPVALASYTVVIVGSHLTGLMDEIMRNTWAGQLEHLVYVLVGVQFFVLVVGNEPIRWQLGAPARWLLLAVAMAVDTFTGVVLLQGTRPVAMLRDPNLVVDALSDTRTGGAMMWFGGDAIMAVVMITLVVGWLRHVDTDRADRKGWLEQARVANFVEHAGSGSVSPDVDTFDDDDAAHTSYNDWLAHLNKQP